MCTPVPSGKEFAGNSLTFAIGKFSFLDQWSLPAAKLFLQVVDCTSLMEICCKLEVFSV